MALPRRSAAGGITGLHRLLTEHGEALEADLAEHYGKRLRDLITGAMTWRELACYVKGLPQESRVAREMHGEVASWSTTDRILADVFDVLAVANWQRGGNKNAPRPQAYPRPKDKQALQALGRRLKKLKQNGAQGD